MRSPVAALLSSAAVLASLLVAVPAMADDAPTPSAPPVADASAPAVPADPEPLLDFPAIANPTISKSNDVPPKLTASFNPGEVPAGATVKWVWLHEGAVISGATSATYVPAAAYGRQTLTARATISKSGYTPVSKTTAGFTDFYLELDPMFAFTGGATVGQTFGLTGVDFANADGVPVTPSVITYQWRRDGTAISGATSAGYQVVGADAGRAISVTIRAQAAGYLPFGYQAIADSPSPASFTVSDPQGVSISGPVSKVLTADVDAGAITDPHPEIGAPTFLYQWYRDGAPISGATHKTYTLTAADISTLTGVEVRQCKAGYFCATVARQGSFTMDPTTSFLEMTTADGTPPHIGTKLQLANPGFTVNGVSADPDISYLWFRDGEKITSADATDDDGDYTIVGADAGHRISARLTAVDPYGDRPTFVFGAYPTQKIGIFFFEPTSVEATVSAAGAPATLTVTDLAVTPVSGMKVAYQWLRNGSPISGATSSTYKLTTADIGTSTRVRLTFTAPSYTPFVNQSDGTNYDLEPDDIPGISGGSAPKVGDTLTAVVPNYTTPGGGHPTPMLTFQWLRNGVAVAGATNPSFVVRSGDKGARFSLKIVASWPGLNLAPGTSMQTPPAASGVLNVAPLKPVVTPTATGLRADLQSGTVSTPQVTLKYQWYRNGAAISGATKQTYPLTSADKGKNIHVRVIVTKANVAPSSATLPLSDPKNYDITVSSPSQNLIPIYGDGRVGNVLTVGPSSAWSWVYEVGGGVAPVGTTKYQWYRQNGPSGTPVAIPGATASTYAVQVADLDKYLRIKLTVSGGVVPRSVFTGAAGPQLLGRNAVNGSGTPILTMNPSTNVITASLQPGSLQPATPTPVYHYTWYRRPTGTPGQDVKIGTTATHKLSVDDYGHELWVRIQVDRAGFEYGYGRSYTVDTTYYNYDLHQSGTTGLTPSPKYNVPITGPLPTYLDSNNNPPTTAPKWTFTWFRLSQPDLFGKVTIISGATKQTYTPTDADIGSYLAFSAVPNYPGYVSPAGGTPISGQVTGSSLGWNGVAPTIVTTASSLKLTASRTGITFTVAPTSYSYQWQRQVQSGGAWTSISGATASTYTMTTADRGYNVRLVITYKKTGYNRVVAISAPVNRTFAAAGPGSMSGTARTDETLTLILPTTTTFITGTYYSIQWYRYDWIHGTSTKITGATKVSYKVTPADAQYASQLYAKLTPVHAGWLGVTTNSVFSAMTALGVIQGDVDVDVPFPAGGVYKATLTKSITTAGVTYSYQWFKDGAQLTGATGTSYDPPGSGSTSLVGTFKLVVTVRKSGYASRTFENSYTYT